MHASFTIRRGLPFAAAAALLAALALAVLPASAQTPPPTEQPNIYISAVDDDGNLTDTRRHLQRDAGVTVVVEVRLGGNGDRNNPVFYTDFGLVTLKLEGLNPTTGLDTSDTVTNTFRASTVWVTEDGMDLTACNGPTPPTPSVPGNRYHQVCDITKAEWKELAGQSTVATQDEATTEVKPIKIGFQVPAAAAFAGTIRVFPSHGFSQSTAWTSRTAEQRTNDGLTSAWRNGPAVDWTHVKNIGVIVPVDAADNPLWVRNSLTQRVDRGTSLQYIFAANQLSHVRLSLGTGRTLDGNAVEPITYADFTEARLGFWDPDNSGVLNTAGANGYHQQVIRATDGTAFTPCADNSGDERCVITKAEWQAAASQMGAQDSEVVKPIRFALRWLSTGRDGTTRWDGTRVNFYAEFQHSGASTYELRREEFRRLSAQISRLQSGARGVGAIEPDMNSAIAADQHIAVDCKQAHVETGAGQTSDCSRAIEVGEAVYLENILRVGGAADNTGRSTNDWRFIGDWRSWLRADAARHGVFFDRIEVAATTGGSPGGGVVVVSSLCPIDAPAMAEHPSGAANVPRGRTAEALAKCVYNFSPVNGTYWGGRGPNFIPAFPSGTTFPQTVRVTVTYRNGPDISSTPIDESFVASDYIDIQVVAATDNTDTGNGGDAWKNGNTWQENQIIAELGQRSRENSLILLMGYPRNRAIPEFWGGLVSPTGPGSIKGAVYGDFAADADAAPAVRLTVPSGGTLSLLGTDKSCTADSAGCTLDILRSDLAQAACYGGPAGCSIPNDKISSTPYWPARLRFDHVGASNVKISGVMTRADGTTHEFSYVARAGAHDATVAAFLPADADKILSPGDTTALGVGYRIPEEGDIEWRAYSPSPEFYIVTGYPLMGSHSPTVELATALATPLQAVTDGAYLSLQGPATWADNGGRRLRMGLDGYGYFKCADVSTLTGVDTDEGRACYITDMNGNAPQVTVASDADEDVRVFADFPLWTLFGDDPPDATHSGGPGHGYFRAQNVHAMQRIDQFGSATLRVATVSQLTSIALDRKPDEDNNVPTAPIRIGGSGQVRLALSNADGAPSQLSSVSAITITVIGGGTLSGYGCENVSSCTIEGDTGALFEAAKTTPGITAAIDLTYKATDKPGEATVEATVVGTDGMTFSERLVLTVSGSATEIATSGDMPRVHSSATEDDDRDKVLIPVTARDANDNAARMPTNAAATVRGIDGAVVPSSSLTSEVICTDGEARLRCNVEIVVTAPSSSPLAAGAYTATVGGSGIVKDTEVSFAVGGPADDVALELPATADLPGLAGSFTATARVVDKDDVPVADGTWVTFRTTAASSGTASAIVTRPSLSDHDDNVDTAAIRRTKTKNGVAEATVTVVGNGIAILTATVGNESANEPIDTRVEAAAAAAPVDGPKLRFESPDGSAATNTLATWISTQTGDAREALEEVPDARVVWLWNGVDWIRWGLTEEGTPIPGSSSTPFTVLPSDRLWFAD